MHSGKASHSSTSMASGRRQNAFSVSSGCANGRRNGGTPATARHVVTPGGRLRVDSEHQHRGCVTGQTGPFGDKGCRRGRLETKGADRAVWRQRVPTGPFGDKGCRQGRLETKGADGAVWRQRGQTGPFGDKPGTLTSQSVENATGTSFFWLFDSEPLLPSGGENTNYEFTQAHA